MIWREISMEKTNRLFTILLIAFFPVELLAFHFRLYQFVFGIMIIQLISILFLSSEKSRMIVWSLNAFVFSYLMILYGYRFIENFNLSLNIILLLGECLQLIPIIALYYVLKMFKQIVQLGFTTKSRRVSKLNKYLIAIIAVSLMFLGLFPQVNSNLLWAFIYCLVHAILFESLWRGILLDLFRQFLSTEWTVLILGVSFGIYLLSFGYNLFLSIFMAFFSLGFSLIKLKTNNILLSILLHTIIVFLLFLSGQFFIPV
jgi:membrane protease YdiL (CAAX protease family)